MATFNHADIDALLHELAQRLDRKGVVAQIDLIGGAAVGYYADRRVTVDIDAVFSPKSEVADEAIRLAQERGLPQDWLNDAARLFIPFNNQHDFEYAFSVGVVTISVAQPRLLLAMKLRANRGPRDVPDVLALLGVCGISSFDEAEDLYGTYHHQELIPDAMAISVRAFFAGR